MRRVPVVVIKKLLDAKVVTVREYSGEAIKTRDETKLIVLARKALSQHDPVFVLIAEPYLKHLCSPWDLYQLPALYSSEKSLCRSIRFTRNVSNKRRSTIK